MKFFIDRKRSIALLFLLILIPSIYSSVSEPHKKMPVVKNGVLDLTEWDFYKDGNVKLDGEWEFYWNQLLTYDDFHNDKNNYEVSGYFHVPNVWNKYIVDGKNLPGAGYATYRLKIKTKDKESLKGLKILTFSTAYKLMINKEIIASSGRVGKSKDTAIPEYKPKAVSFKNDNEDFEMIIQVSNYMYGRGGFWHSIYLGEEQQIRTMKENSARREMFLFGVVFIMILYQVAIYLLQRRSILALYYVLILFVVAIRILVTGEYFIFNIIPSMYLSWVVLVEYMTIYWGPTAWVAFINELYPEKNSSKAVKLFTYIALILTIFTMITPVRIYTRVLIYDELLVAGIFCYAVFSICIATIRRKEGAKLLLVGTIIFLGTFINDVLYHWNIIESKPGGMFGFAAFFIIFIQAYVLAARFSKAFDEVEELSDKMISLNKFKDEFLANTSHELRTPLHGMISITQSVLQSSEEQLNKKQKENLILVVSSGKRLANLVNDILDYSKLKYGDVKLYRKSVDIIQIVQTVLEVHKHVTNNAVVVKNNVSENIPYIYGDEDRIIQIVYNLVGNAVKFTESGEIKISAIEKEGMVEISVEDTGIGIHKDKLDDIFKSFEQVDTSITRGYGGTGIGLSITKNLVEIQGGQIWVISTVGKGTKFTFSMPVSRENKEMIVSKNKNDYEYHNLHNQFSKDPVVFQEEGEFTILIVDDDYINLQSLVNILTAEKYSVIAATNGMKALDVISKNKKIDLVILDIMMPKMSGYEVCRKIRQEYSLYDLPVIMLTANSNSESILTGFESGANDFLSKPFDMGELRARVKTLLELKKSIHYGIQAEMAFLQAQIKPHFLYNALNTIVSLCWIDPEKAAEMIMELSNYLRGSFDFSNMDKFIRIEKEIEFIQSYIAIEKARFEEKLNFQYDVDENLKFMIPTLILQPIVENAVKHGILPKEEGGNVKISIIAEVKFIMIKVEDDGVGIPREKLDNMLIDDTAGKSVGLRNVNKRMKQIYGYGIEIESEMGKGTKVCIKIPYERGEIHA